jgi:hypothetical protein
MKRPPPGHHVAIEHSDVRCEVTYGAMLVAHGYGSGGEARRPLGLAVVRGLMVSQRSRSITMLCLHVHGRDREDAAHSRDVPNGFLNPGEQ